MTDFLGVDTGVVETAALDVAEATLALQRSLADMQVALAPLTYLWTGAASQAFAGARQEWESSLDDMIDVLRRLGASVETSARRYGLAETDATALWS